MTWMNIFLPAGALVLVLGGLWAFDWLCITEDQVRYRRWVEEREEILAELKAGKNRSLRKIE